MAFVAGKLIYFGVGRYVVRNPFVRADDAVFADGYVSQYGGLGVDDYVVFQVRVAFDSFDGVAVFIQRKAFCSQRYALVELDVGADNARFADDDARPVVDKEPGADLRARGVGPYM